MPTRHGRCFLALVERARALPEPLLRELLALADAGSATWSGGTLLRDVAAERGIDAAADRVGVDGVERATIIAAAARERPAPPRPRLHESSETEPAVQTEDQTDVEAKRPEPAARPPRVSLPEGSSLAEHAAAVLAAGRRNPTLFGAFENRAEQIGMLRAVANALDSDSHLLVEAGTGTGKSLAYLIPAALQALQDGRRVIIGTSTINLQEQLWEKDVPALRTLMRDALGDEPADPLRVALLKGRRNYLCRRRLQAQRDTTPASSLDAELLARVLVWLERTETGDRSELRVGPTEEAAWSRISAEGADCLSDRTCPFVRDGSCFLLQARRQAEAAHVVITNHALLFSDMAAGGSVLPAADAVVLDEAHHLEDVATSHLGVSFAAGSFLELADLAHRRGPGGRDAGLACAVITTQAGERASERALPDLATAAEAVRGTVATLFDRMRQFVSDQTGDSVRYESRLRLSATTRAQPDWSAIETAWERTFSALRALHDDLDPVMDLLADSASPDRDALLAECESLIEALRERSERCGDLVTRNDPETIVWLTTSGRGETATLNAAPLRVDATLAADLFAQYVSVILTGATLCVDGSFGFLRERLGVPEDAVEEQFGSPFDYRRAAQLLVPTDMSDPSDRGYQWAVEETLLELVLASEGRALALFTSHQALAATADRIRGPLEDAGIVVLAQGIDGSPRRVISALEENPRAVVLGTASLWEGVDLPGPAVSLLVIARLPFAVPTDPVYAARSEQYDNPFLQYAVPLAIVRFRQGVGRLIRRRNDRGVVAVLDGRITTKRYGASFIRSLPPFDLQETSVHGFAMETRRWLQL